MQQHHQHLGVSEAAERVQASGRKHIQEIRSRNVCVQNSRPNREPRLTRSEARRQVSGMRNLERKEEWETGKASTSGAFSSVVEVAHRQRWYWRGCNGRAMTVAMAQRKYASPLSRKTLLLPHCRATPLLPRMDDTSRDDNGSSSSEQMTTGVDSSRTGHLRT